MLYFIIILLFIIDLFLRIKNKKNTNSFEDELQEPYTNYKEKYIKKDYLLTQTELKFYKQLKKITDEKNLIICPQVSLYEIVRNKNFKGFNKIASKSIDFVIAEPNLKIIMCIELDDYTHQQSKRIKRDKFINDLFNNLEIKFIRFDVQNFYNIEELQKKIEENL